MIKYKFKHKRKTSETQGFEESVYTNIEEEIKQRLHQKILPFEEELQAYDVTIDVDVEKSETKVSSQNMPEDLLSQIQITLDK